MTKCVICKKELPEGTKVPMCEYHRAQAKEKGAAAAVGVVGAVGTVAKMVPKVAPIVKEKGPAIANGALSIAKTVIRK